MKHSIIMTCGIFALGFALALTGHFLKKLHRPDLDHQMKNHIQEYKKKFHNEWMEKYAQSKKCPYCGAIHAYTDPDKVYICWNCGKQFQVSKGEKHEK